MINKPPSISAYIMLIFHVSVYMLTDDPKYYTCVQIWMAVIIILQTLTRHEPKR